MVPAYTSTVGPPSVPGVGLLWITCTLAVWAVSAKAVQKQVRRVRSLGIAANWVK